MYRYTQVSPSMIVADRSQPINGNVPGKYYITINYNGSQVSGAVYIYDPAVSTLVDISSSGNLPYLPNFVVGSNLEDYVISYILNQRVLAIYGNNGDIEQVNKIVRIGNIITTGFDNNKVGVQTITISFGEKETLSLDVTCIPDYTGVALTNQYMISEDSMLYTMYGYTSVTTYANGYAKFVIDSNTSNIDHREYTLNGEYFGYYNPDMGGKEYYKISEGELQSLTFEGNSNDTYYTEAQMMGYTMTLRIRVYSPTDGEAYSGNNGQECWAVVEMPASPDPSETNYMPYATIQVLMNKESGTNGEITAFGKIYTADASGNLTFKANVE